VSGTRFIRPSRARTPRRRGTRHRRGNSQGPARRSRPEKTVVSGSSINPPRRSTHQGAPATR
jgi:hypothetical protein